MVLLRSAGILSPNCQKTDYAECYIALWIWKIVPFLLVVVGIIGNILSLIVLSSPQLRKKSTCVYLMFLAVTDSTLLCSAPLRHTLKHTFGINTWVPNFFSCTFSWLGVYASGMISCWLIVMITAERTLLSLFPTRAKPMMTPRNAVIVSVAVSILVILLNWHFIYGNTVVERLVNVTEFNVTSIETVKACFYRRGKFLDFYRKIFNYLLIIIGSIVPILLIVTGNIIVATSLIKSRRALRRVQNGNGRNAGRMTQSTIKSKVNYKLFFILCGVYIMSTVPYAVYLTAFPFSKEVDNHTVAKYQLGAVVIRCLIWSNFSFNFFLYFLTGSLFRREIKRRFDAARKYLTSVRDRSRVQPQNNRNS